MKIQYINSINEAKKHKSILNNNDKEELSKLQRIIFVIDDKNNNLVLNYLGQQTPKAKNSLINKIKLLDELGINARRPLVDYLRDDIYELRDKEGKINHRLLYFFDRDQIIIVTHGFSKEAEVPNREIEFAIKCRKEYFKEKNKLK